MGINNPLSAIGYRLSADPFRLAALAPTPECGGGGDHESGGRGEAERLRRWDGRKPIAVN